MRSHKAIIRLLFFALVAGFVPLLAHAQEEEPGRLMVVHGVAVDETAESAVAARQAAIENGQKKAFQQLLQRITLREHWPELPDPGAIQLADYVESLAISDEKTSAVRYLARLTVRFKPDRVRRLMERLEIPYTETRSKPVLVLPVMERQGALLLFEETNTWRAAWDTMETPSDPLLPVVLPLGDLEDMTSVTPEVALAGDPGAFAALRERYEVEGIVVLHAIVAPDLKSGGALKVDVLRHSHGGAASGVVVSGYRQATGESESEFMTRVAGLERQELEEAWKRRTLLFAGDEVALSVRVPISTLNDWLGVRRKLQKIGMIRQISLQTISRIGAQIELRYIGDAERLRVSLAQQDLILDELGGFWVLEQRASATGDEDRQ